MASVLVNRAPALLSPVVVLETDRTLAIRNPTPESRVDYLIIPKKDIADPGQLSDGDRPYLDDAYAVMERLIQRDGLTDYQIVAYGPTGQSARYLHFHLKAR